jgi:predicted GIY-YIG superfamily endonuclease
MHYVYRIQSLRYPEREYTGFTSNLKARLEHHNEGCCDYTRPFKPWKVVWYSTFETEEKARAFERYLKSGSGSAFAKKRLW